MGYAMKCGQTRWRSATASAWHGITSKKARSRAKQSAGTICSAAVDSNGFCCWLPLWLMTVDIGEAVFLCQGTCAVYSTSFRDDLRVGRQCNHGPPDKQRCFHPLFECLAFALRHDHFCRHAIRAEGNHRDVMGP